MRKGQQYKIAPWLGTECCMYADDTDIIASRAALSLKNVTSMIAEVCREFRLTVFETKAETMYVRASKKRRTEK